MHVRQRRATIILRKNANHERQHVVAGITAKDGSRDGGEAHMDVHRQTLGYTLKVPNLSSPTGARHEITHQFLKSIDVDRTRKYATTKGVFGGARQSVASTSIRHARVRNFLLSNKAHADTTVR